MILSNTQNKPKRHIKGGWVNPSSLPKNKDGMTQCRWCSGSVLPPRRTFCSDECVHQHRLRTNSTYLRTCVYKRDNGICAICHQDTKLIARQAKKYKANKEWKSFYKLLDDNNIHHKEKYGPEDLVVVYGTLIILNLFMKAVDHVVSIISELYVLPVIRKTQQLKQQIDQK